MKNYSSFIKQFLLVTIFAAVIGAVILLVQSMPKPGPASGRLQVVASFYPLYFFSQVIGGDKAEVINIVPAGAEPHDYEPTGQDIAKMESSRLIVLNGGRFEAWADNIKQNILNSLI